MEELTQDGAQLARTMLMSAAQLAESMARVRAQRAWMAQNRFTALAAQAQQQIAAERDAARLDLPPLTDDRYWHDAPQLDRVVQAHMTAASWAEHDPEARADVQLIKQHAEERWVFPTVHRRAQIRSTAATARPINQSLVDVAKPCEPSRPNGHRQPTDYSAAQTNATTKKFESSYQRL